MTKQTVTIDNVGLQNVELKSFVSDSINRLNQSLVELNGLINVNESKFQNKLENASNTIEYLNNLVGTFGVIFTVLTCVIALITIGLPIITFQFGIKPSRKALRDLEINMDHRLEKYLKDNREKQITQALDNIKSDNQELKNHGLNFLSLTHYQGLSNEQLFTIYSIIKGNITEQTTINQLSYILSTRKNEFADDLFNDKQYLDLPVIKQMALLYFSKMGFDKNISGLKKIINISSDKSHEYFVVLISIMTYSSSDLIKAMNNEELIQELDEQGIIALKDNYKTYLKTLNVSQEEFEHTRLFKRINKYA